MQTISALYNADANKAHRLYKAMAKGAPVDVRKMIKVNTTPS